MKILFATRNPHKAQEIQQILGTNINLVSFNDLHISGEAEEIGSTLWENALLKARYGYQKSGIPCFADDTGLEVPSLNGAPGVYSARYAGEACNAEDNMNKLLTELENKPRDARFVSIIALVTSYGEYILQGISEGEILKTRAGKKGFGYDPVFKPKDAAVSFAEMSREEKNAISHRAKAAEELRELLSFVKI